MKPYNVTIYWLNRKPEGTSVRAANEMQAVYQAVNKCAQDKEELYDHMRTRLTVKEIVFS